MRFYLFDEPASNSKKLLGKKWSILFSQQKKLGWVASQTFAARPGSQVGAAVCKSVCAVRVLYSSSLALNGFNMVRKTRKTGSLSL